MMLLLCALMVGSGSAWADDTFVKVTSSSQINVGSKIIFVCEENSQAMQNDANYSGTNVTITESEITLGASSTVCVMTVGGESGAYTFAVSDGKLLSWKKNGFQINFTTGNADKWTIASDGSFTCNVSGVTDSSTRKQVRHNTSSTNKFGCYTSSTGKAVCIYVKEVAKTDPTITFNNGSVRVGKTLDLSTLFTSNSAGAVTYSITEGGSYASIDGSTLTGVAEGSVTVQASQAAAGAYNEKTASATITVNAALTLSSIAITTAPTKTTYDEGEVFDATGMVVTATYSDASTDDVTALCTWTPSGALTTSDTEITVSYTENSTTKTATQTITVNEYVQPTDITATFNNVFLGVDAGSRISEKTTITQDRIEFVFDKVSGSNWPQGDAGVIRIYSGTTLQINAPLGYALSSITFTANGDWKNGMTASVGKYNDTTDDDNKTYWTGFASSVTFTPGGTHRIATVNITLSSTVPVTITSAEYATYCGAIALDFSTTGITAYTATDGETKVTLNEIESGKVPANTPVVLYKACADGTAINVPVTASADAVEGTNDLHVSTGTDVDYMYVLSKQNEKVGFYPWGGTNLSAGKIYLQGKASYGARSFIGFDDVTAVGSMKALPAIEGAYYNLNGQQVTQPAKGLYIVNGKKVIFK